ncbi:MAG: DUF3098 domain-containing protein [Bacteroidetes bacterium]|nr:DUF3098 domain-containing protein [Bacteroidota bacterium]MBS1629256.1 DUF3098 domain-containing protein [Bacteroidota bacterium]
MAKSTSHTAYSSSTAKSSISRKSSAPSAPRGNQVFLFDKSNFIWMGIGMACIILGFALMSGGKSPDPHQFLYDEIYSFRRITLAPIVILIGFGIEAYAILMRPKKGPEKQA